MIAPKENGQKKALMYISGFVMLAFLAYGFGVKKTIALAREQQELTGQTQAYQQWKSESQQAEATPATALHPDDVQHNLFDQISHQAHASGLQVLRIFPPHTVAQSGLYLSTYQVQIQGNFKPMLALVHHLETTFSGARVSSYSIEKRKDLRTKKEHLVMTLIVQSLSTEITSP